MVMAMKRSLEKGSKIADEGWAFAPPTTASRTANMTPDQSYSKGAFAALS